MAIEFINKSFGPDDPGRWTSADGKWSIARYKWWNGVSGDYFMSYNIHNMSKATSTTPYSSLEEAMRSCL